MAKLIYYMNMSLDGYIADEAGKFDFSEPSDEVHQFINDLVRPVGTYLIGRRMYEVMTYWETVPTDDPGSPISNDFAGIWHSMDKVVYSRTLTEASTRRTRLEAEFDIDTVRAMKEDAEADMIIAGPNLASQAIASGVVDELQFVIAPALVGKGNAALPPCRLDLSLLDQRRFENGSLFVRYSVNA